MTEFEELSRRTGQASAELSVRSPKLRFTNTAGQSSLNSGDDIECFQLSNKPNSIGPSLAATSLLNAIYPYNPELASKHKSRYG